MLITFPVQNSYLSYHIPEFQYCFDYLLMLSIFMCQCFFKKVSLSGGHKVSLRMFL